MLSIFRGAMGGWVAKFFLALLVISFAVWGVQGSLVQGAGSSVVSVGQTKVSPLEYRLAYDQQLNQLQRQFGQRLTRDQANAFGLSGGVLNQLVSSALLDETGRKMELGVSKDRLASLIGDDPSFRDAAGKFSRIQLQQALSSIGMQEDQYVATRKAVAIRSQIIEGTTQKTAMPDAYFDILASYQNEKRKFVYVTVLPSDIASISAPTDEQLKTYYDANLKNYVAPEYRKLNLLKLEPADLADEVSLSEEDIAADYEKRKGSFTDPETRTIQQLVFTDRVKAEEASTKLKSGTTFETIMSELGKSDADISLGTLQRSAIPDKNIADAAFALSLNQPSEVVDGLFGAVILRATEIKPESVKPLIDVKDEIKKELALAKAADQIFEAHDKIEDERAAGETLEKAADAAGVKIRVVEAVDATSRAPDGTVIDDLPQSQELLKQAFETNEGVEADPISIGSNGFVWFEVASITSSRQQTLDEVKEQISKDWLAVETAKSVETLAENLRKRVSDGEVLGSAVAALLKPEADGTPRKVETGAEMLRTDTSKDLSAEAVQAGFEVVKGSVVLSSPPSDNEANKGGKIVLFVQDVIAGPKVLANDQVKTQLNSAIEEDVLTQMVAKIQSIETVEINQQALTSALSY